MVDLRVNFSTPTLAVPQAQPNPIDALTTGLTNGASLGFAAQKMAILQKQQEEQAKENKINLLKAYNDQYEKFSDMPSMQKYILQNQILPLTNELMGPHGQQIDTSQINFQEDQDPLKELHALNKKLGNKEIDLPTYASALSVLESEHAKNKPFVSLAEKQINDSIRLQQMQSLEDQRNFMHSQKGEADKSRLDGAIARFSQQLDSDPVLRKVREQSVSLEQIPDLIDAIKKGNTVGASALGVRMARTMGEVGVLTNSDVTRYVQSPELARNISDKFTRLMSGKPTNMTLNEVDALTGVMKKAYDAKVQSIYNRNVERLANNFDISKEEAAKRLVVPYTGGAADGDITSLSDEELLKLANGGQ